MLLVERADALEGVFREAINTPEALQAMARTAQAYVAGRDLETSQAIDRIMTLLDQ